MKIELTTNDLAPYLPFDLKIQGQTLGQIETLSTLSDTSVNIKGRGTQYGMWADISDIKPILRPLSDLNTKKLPLFKNPVNSSPAVIFNNKTIEMCYWKEYQYLLENHFDMFGLIKQGLAIDINTL